MCPYSPPVGMTCHREDECGGAPFPVQSITMCCSELKGSSISFTASGGICQPCISKPTPVIVLC